MRSTDDDDDDDNFVKALFPLWVEENCCFKNYLCYNRARVSNNEVSLVATNNIFSFLLLYILSSVILFQGSLLTSSSDSIDSNSSTYNFFALSILISADVWMKTITDANTKAYDPNELKSLVHDP